MTVDLSDYVETLKRGIQPPGLELFATVSDTQWVGYLTDAFWEARLDGFMENYVADEDGIVTGDPDLERQYVALITLYAAIKVLRNKILNTATSFRAQAGPVEFEQQNSATMLAEMLRQLQAAKDNILEQIDAGATEVLAIDALSVRLLSPGSYFGSPELTG